MKFKLLTTVRHYIEGFFVALLYGFFRHVLPGRTSVDFAGWLGRQVGPRLYLSKRASTNILNCFPNKSETEIQQVIVEMWENFGRLMGEYVKETLFWDGKKLKNIEIRGIEHLKAFKESGNPGIIFTGHIGHWQMITLVAQSIGVELTQMYRPPNNPWVDMLMLRCQKHMINNVITKGNSGPKKFFSLINEGGHAFLLVDQNTSEGMSVPFLGKNAKTTTGIAKMYLHKNCTLLPARSERLKGSTFRVTFYPPISYQPTGNEKKDIYGTLLEINNHLSQWITERPGQWLWLHRRWKGA